MTVRSSRLASHFFGSTAAATIFTCPAGWRAIVKDVRVDSSAASTTHVTLVLYQQDGSNNLSFEVGVVNPGAPVGMTAWTVLYPGDYLTGQSDQVGARIWISGTLLQLTGVEPM